MNDPIIEVQNLNRLAFAVKNGDRKKGELRDLQKHVYLS